MKKILLALVLGTFLISGNIVSAAMDPATIGTTGQNGSTAVVDPTTTTSTTPTQSSSNILGIDDADLRTGNVSMDSIPAVIISVINVLLGVAGTVAVVALIYYAVQMQLASGITGDSSKVDNAKRGMTGALIGFVVAILAWFIVIRFVEILSSVS